MKKEKEFLNKYQKLCLEYNLEITGCGECGSAWLDKLDGEKLKNKTLGYREGFQVIGFIDDDDKNNEEIIKLTPLSK